MKKSFSSLFLTLTVASFFLFTPSTFSEESITLTTYYPAPYGVYHQISSNKLITGVAQATPAEFAAMSNGDVHIGRSLIVGAGGSGFSYQEKQAAGTPLADGDVLVKGNEAVAGQLQLGNFADDPDPAMGDGTLYYNTDNHTFRGYQDGAWGLITGAFGESVMYLRTASPDCSAFAPAACPADWVQAGLDIEYEDVGQIGVGVGIASNCVRTCYRDDRACRVMRLRTGNTGFQSCATNAPAACPVGWTQADLKQEYMSIAEHSGTILYNCVRTCYRCP